MKLYIQNRRIIVWIFIFVVAISSANLIVEARSYLLMYASINKLQFTLSGMAFRGSSPSNSVVLVQLRADNPVDYGGLEATLVYLTANFTAGGSSVFEKRPLGWSWIISTSLAANGSTNWNFTMPLNPQNATSLFNFYQSNNPNIIADATFTVAVTTTFLATITEGSTLYQEKQTLALT